MCTIYIYILNPPEIDKIWIFHDISKNNLKNGTLIDFVIFYLLQDDSIDIYNGNTWDILGI